MCDKKTSLVLLVIAMMILSGTVMAAVKIDRTGSFEITYSSSINANENGERVFDDIQNTKWLTAGGQTSGWIVYDFNDEDAYVIDGYTIKSANDSPDRSPKNWTLQGSNNGSAWETLDTRTDETDWDTFETRSYSFANTTAYKMYKLNVTANNGSGSLMGFCELELLEGAADRTAMPGTITGSSQIGDRESAYAAFDNTDQTKWLTGFETTGWIIFDFPDDQAYAINGYTITSANDSPERTPRDWSLQGSDNGLSWTDVDIQTNETGWTTFEKRNYLFNNSTAYKMYRLNVTANNGSGNLMGFSELELLEIIDDPQITTMTPGNFNSVSDNPLVLAWDSAFETASATYTLRFGTDPNFVEAGSIEQSGLTAKHWTVPETSIADDTVYYWRVDIVDDPYETGTQTFKGSAVKFRVLRQTQKVLEWSMDSYGAGNTYNYEVAIQNVTATASSEEQSNRSPDNTTGPGMVIDAAIYEPNGLTHSNDALEMWISHPDQTGDVWIKYEFDQPYQIGTMLIWNHNVGEPWTSELNRGMRNVTVQYSDFDSSDPNDWTELGSYEIPMGAGLPFMQRSIAIDFDGAEARYVRIVAAEVNGNWGAANHYALSEVRFGLYNQPGLSFIMPDTSGNGNEGYTYINPELVSEAIAGKSIDLTGDDMVYMELTDPNLNETLPMGKTEDCYDSWSMNFYTVLPETPPAISFVVGFGDFETGTGRYIAQFSEGIHFWGGADIDGVTNVEFDLNRWQMITATYESGILRLYKNGQTILNKTVDLGIATPKVSICGLSPWSSVPSPVKAKIDEFTIYRGALTQSEIDALAAALPTQYAALDPVPSDESTNVRINPVLKWSAPLSAIDPTYDVYLGTDINSLSLVASGLTENEFDTISLDLDYETAYYWNVDTSTGNLSETWSFTTLPAASAPSLALGWDFENLTEYPVGYEKAIANVGATASSEEQANRGANLAVNGIGLFADPSVVADPNGIGLLHSDRPWYMWISDPYQTGDVWIKFSFDQSYSLGTMLVWNHNVGEPWTSELDRGMRNVEVTYSDVDSNDPNDWTILGSYEIPMGTGQPDMHASIWIEFGGVEAQYVKITAAETDGNWGAYGRHALSEVRFGIYGTTAAPKVVVPDTSGNGNVGLVSGSPDFVPGIGSGQCVQIHTSNIDRFGDEINASIPNADTLPFNAADPWSMNYYVYLYEQPPVPTLMAGFGGTSAGTGRFVGRFNGVHFWGGDNVDVASNPPQAYRLGHWQMITATYDGTELKLYHNGSQVGSGSPSFEDAEQTVNIAGLYPWNSNASRINGLVDNFTLYKGVLSRKDIAALADEIPLDGDVDWNGTVDALDLADFASYWLSSADCASPADFTGDCYVTLEDFAAVAENWLKIQ